MQATANLSGGINGDDFSRIDFPDNAAHCDRYANGDFDYKRRSTRTIIFVIDSTTGQTILGVFS